MDHDKALSALKSIIAQYGSNIIYDKESLPSLFKAAAPELTEEYSVLKIFYDNEMYKAFSETSKDIADRDNTIRYLGRKLVSEFSVSPELAKEITDLFSAVLGWDYNNENLDMRGKAATLLNRVMNNKKKLYILSVIGVALVAAIIILVVIIRDNLGSVKPRSIPKSTASPSEHTEVQAETAEPTEDITESPAVSVEIPTEELAGILDAADDDYKSFEVLPVDSPDFFLNRNLRLVAMLKDHQMSMYYDQNITALYTDKTISMSFKDKDGNYQKMENNVYDITDAVTTPDGRDCFMIAFGDHDMTDDNKKFNTDCFALIKMRDDIDMGDAKAEAYVLLIEDAKPDTYEILKIEE